MRGLARDRYVLFLSHLSEAKGVDDLIAGFARTRCRHPAKLVIAGNDPEAVALRSQVAHSPAAHRIVSVAEVDDTDDAEKPPSSGVRP